MTCTCTPCPFCDGSGVVWWSCNGEYLGNSRCDDLDEMEACEECDGTGIDVMCDECLLAEEEDACKE